MEGRRASSRPSPSSLRPPPAYHHDAEPGGTTVAVAAPPTGNRLVLRLVPLMVASIALMTLLVYHSSSTALDAAEGETPARLARPQQLPGGRRLKFGFALPTVAQALRRETSEEEESVAPETDEAGLREELKGCRYIYLDVGTNVGVQVRKLFEPELFPGSTILRHFDAAFGADRAHMPGLCALGFEPNPTHTAALKALEREYNSRGWRTVLWTETAVLDEDREAVDFYMDHIKNHQVGSSVIAWRPDLKRPEAHVTVRSIDLARFVTDLVAATSRQGPDGAQDPVILMKLDAEGAEYRILDRLIRSGAICMVDRTVAELHMWGRDEYSAQVAQYRHPGQVLHHFQRLAVEVAGCPWRAVVLDDEQYGGNDVGNNGAGQQAGVVGCSEGRVRNEAAAEDDVDGGGLLTGDRQPARAWSTEELYIAAG